MIQHTPTVSQLREPDSIEDELQMLTLNDGQRVTVVEYKLMRQAQAQQQQPTQQHGMLHQFPNLTHQPFIVHNMLK